MLIPCLLADITDKITVDRYFSGIDPPYESYENLPLFLKRTLGISVVK